MFNIGIIEFLIIFFVIVLFIKPEDIPKISKNAGLFYRKITRYFYNFKYELSNLDLDSELKDKTSKKKKKSNKNKKNIL